VIDRTAAARIQRLMRWLEPFQRCFGHRAKRLALRTYVQGVFSDSERKSMQAMLARVTEPVSYQAFQHFITHAPWDADRIWRRLVDVLPERRGMVIIDGTSFPKQGPHSVGVARQYCGALGKIANCHVALTAALWTGGRAWLLGALLYLPQSWLENAARRAVAHIPTRVSFQEKWRQAITLIRRARAAGLQVTAVVADAEFRRYHGVPARVASIAPPVCLGDLAPSDRVSRHARRAHPTRSAHRPPPVAARDGRS
jgi:SRSO17 transposase